MTDSQLDDLLDDIQLLAMEVTDQPQEFIAGVRRYIETWPTMDTKAERYDMLLKHAALPPYHKVHGALHGVQEQHNEFELWCKTCGWWDHRDEPFPEQQEGEDDGDV